MPGPAAGAGPVLVSSIPYCGVVNANPHTGADNPRTVPYPVVFG
ncbi:MAG: hypothetical protein WDM88_00725 [Galbitalea sp.]